MASSRNNKSSKSSGSSGLRILWLPGGRKNHNKGRFDSTNKKIDYSSKQKKSEVWSLGGKKAHEDMIKLDPDTTLFDGPSVSGVTPVTCAIGAVGVAGKCTTTTTVTSNNNGVVETTTTTIENQSPPDILNGDNLPITPNSTTSTAPLVSIPNSPVSTLPNDNDTMPAKTTAAPVVTTTTAEIIDENRFSILNKDISGEIDIYALPRVPKDDLNGSRNNLLLNTSAGSTATNPTTTSSPSISPKSDTKSMGKDSSDSPTKQKPQHKNHNNNHQSDINSIESISENTKVPNADLDWIDELLLERNSKEILTKGKKKKKKKISTTKELDQLDGVPSKQNHSEAYTDEDEKVVKCLYYTLMCCECTIS